MRSQLWLFIAFFTRMFRLFFFFRCSIFRQPVNVSFLFYLSIIETQCWTHFSLSFSFWAFSFSVVFTNWLQKKKLGHKLLASSSIIYISRLTFYALLATIMGTSSGLGRRRTVRRKLIPGVEFKSKICNTKKKWMRSHAVQLRLCSRQ